MTGIDWVIAGLVTIVALFGWSQGFLAGALSLAGFALGAWLGTRIGPLVLPDAQDSPYAPVFALAGPLLVGVVLAVGFEGVGERIRRALPLGGPRALDGLLGAALMACVGLGIAWVLGAVALQTPGARQLRADIQRSVILARLNAILPSRELLNALARFDPFPSVSGPEAAVGPPPKGIAAAPGVAAAKQSVVRVLGTACGLGVQGSGWVARDGLVVTNAHVVAGQEDTVVQLGYNGRQLSATAVHFDSRNDLAVLRVPGLSVPPLELAHRAPSGTGAAVAGYPRNGPYRVRAARIGVTRDVLTDDAYGAGPVRRRVVALRGLVQSGNSGGPVVNRRGAVLGTVFAAARTGRRGGFAVPNAITAAALKRSDQPVSTGPCAR